MKLADYLQSFQKCHRVCVVGPMLRVSDTVNVVDEPVVWVDGGAKHRRDGVGCAVGDGDSFDGELDELLNPDKDFSDLAFVLRNLPDNFTEVTLRGFLGGRRDHELFNFGEVHQLLTGKTKPTRVLFDDQVAAYSAGSWTFQARGLFSLAVLATATVTLNGECEYPIGEPLNLAPLTSLGLSNRGFGEIALTTDAPAFILHTL